MKKIKPLGAFVILAEGETDWKIVAVGVGDPLANELSEICDVQRCFPGFVDSLKVWYRRYKVPEGKDEDMLGLHGELMSREPSVSDMRLLIPMTWLIQEIGLHWN